MVQRDEHGVSVPRMFLPRLPVLGSRNERRQRETHDPTAHRDPKEHRLPTSLCQGRRVVGMRVERDEKRSGRENVSGYRLSATTPRAVDDTVPKTMQVKARRLMEHLKRDIAWTARVELIHEGVPIFGSNVVDLVNDLLRERKTDPIGWQPFARQLHAINLPMELIGNTSRKAYIRQATTTATPSRRRTRADASSARRSLSWTPLARRRSRMEHSMPTPPSERRQKHKTLKSLTSWEDF